MKRMAEIVVELDLTQRYLADVRKARTQTPTKATDNGMIEYIETLTKNLPNWTSQNATTTRIREKKPRNKR